MTKNELKKLIAETNEGMSQVDAEKAIDMVFEGIKTGLIQDGKVGIYKTMTLEVKDTKPSSGVINGVEWSKPAGKRISVKVADAFMEDIVGE